MVRHCVLINALNFDVFRICRLVVWILVSIERHLFNGLFFVIRLIVAMIVVRSIIEVTTSVVAVVNLFVSFGFSLLLLNFSEPSVYAP